MGLRSLSARLTPYPSMSSTGRNLSGFAGDLSVDRLLALNRRRNLFGLAINNTHARTRISSNHFTFVSAALKVMITTAAVPCATALVIFAEAPVLTHKISFHEVHLPTGRAYLF